MRVGFDISPLFVRSAGVATYVRQLAIELQKILGREQLSFVPKNLERGLKVNQLLFEQKACPLTTRLLAIPGLYYSLRQRLGLKNSGGAFANCSTVHLAEIAPQLKKTVNCVANVHDMACWRYPQYFKPQLVLYQQRRLDYLKKRADLVIASSSQTADDLIKLYQFAAERIRVIPLAVAQDFFKKIGKEEIEAVKSKFSINGDYLFFVGTIEPRKNIANLIEAFKLLPSLQLNDLKLVIAGQRGWLFDKRFKKPFNRQNIIYLGPVSSENLRVLYQGALALVYPTHYEGFGLPALEAQASGTPLITSDIAVMRETAGEAALYIDPKDPRSIAKAIRELAQEPSLRHTLAAKGRLHATQYSWEKVATEVVGFYV